MSNIYCIPHNTIVKSFIKYQFYFKGFSIAKIFFFPFYLSIECNYEYNSLNVVEKIKARAIEIKNK